MAAFDAVVDDGSGRRRDGAGPAGNHANALLHRFLQRGGDAEEAALAASRAVQLRQELLDPGRPISLWELGNTYAVYAHCLALIGEFERAGMVLQLGEQLAGVMGPADGGIAAKLRAAAALVDAARNSTKRRPWNRRR